MMYVAKVKYYIPEEEKSEEESLFISGSHYHDVTEKLTGFYGEGEIEAMSISIFGPDDFIVFDDEDKHLFEIVKDKLEKKVVW